MGMSVELPPKTIIEQLAANQYKEGAHTYALPRGESELLTAISLYMNRRFNVQVASNENVCVLPGNCPGIFFIMKDLLKPGIVALPTPGYPPFFTAAKKGGHDICATPLTIENNFMPDISKAVEILQAKQKLNDLNALFINYPHNPTGAVANLQYLEGIVNLARKHSFLVISDMTYSDIYNPSCEKPHSIFEIPGAESVAIELHTFGKTFSMTGDRAGFVISNPEVIKLFETYIKHVHIGNVPKPIQLAIASGLNDPQCLDYVQQNNIGYSQKFDLMTDGLTKLGWEIPNFTRAGFFLWVPVLEKDKSSRDFFYDLLYKAGVVVVPGSDFGEEGEGYIRISLTQPISKLKEVLQRLETNGFDYSKK